MATEAPGSPSRWAAGVVLVCIGAWWWPISLAFGGRDAGAVTAGLALLVPALVAARVDRLPRRHLAALTPGFVAACAVVWSPTAGDGLDEASLWIAAGLVYLVAAGWRRAGGSSWILLGPIAVGAIVQVWIGWWIWFGQGGASLPMVGTFYWHNQFGAFQLAVAVTAGTLFVHGGDRGRLVASAAFTTGALASVATVFSGSRACTALLAASAVVVALTCLRAPRRLMRIGALAAAAVVLGSALTWALPSGGTATQALDSRGQSAVGNAEARVDYVVAAWRILERAPWTGSGADSFGTAATAVSGDLVAPTQWVHNGYLQAFVDGGLLLGLAVTACTLAVLLLGLRGVVIRGHLFRRNQRIDAVQGAALMGAAVLAAHSAFDFDWAYPVLVALFAVLAAVIVVPDATCTGDERGPAALVRTSAGPALNIVVVVVALLVGLGASAGVDAAAATGGATPGWRAVLTGGLVGDAFPGSLRAASECRSTATNLLADQAPIANSTVEELVACLQPTLAFDPAVGDVIDQLRESGSEVRG